MALPGIVTFTTDFGDRDTFVGQMKGVALAIHPGLTLVDLTHAVPAHDIVAGAVALRTAYRAFPSGTVHVAVVDPGVGTTRRGLVVRTESYYFVAPDNGILSLVLAEESGGIAHALEAGHLRRPNPSATFEGRDVFTPAAAWVNRGVDLERFGPRVEDPVRFDLAEPRLERGRWVPVRVLLVDRFGNVTLNLSRHALGGSSTGGARLQVKTPGGTVERLVGTYADGEAGRPVLLFNSADYLELAVREGRASEHLGLAPGDEVSMTVLP